MDFSSINPILLLASLMVAATPIILAAAGELIVERAGVLNLGVEGMMITGAITGFIATVTTGSPWIGFAAGWLGSRLALLAAGWFWGDSYGLPAVFPAPAPTEGILLGGTLVLALVAAAWPAWRAYRTDIAATLGKA